MAKWSAGSETGILRKPTTKDKFDDLLVFGYACKIFRDDEKALYIDKGKHLIPWMGSNTLKIDRYDCRGALSDLALYEGSGQDTSQWLGFGDSERRIELLCDEERYYALKYNEEELEMYQEEESKRLLQKGTEFQYNYDVPRNPNESENAIDTAEQDEEFVPPPELNIPSGMEVPKTVKENARIEKTAVFVSNQGPQMEILIKTKQADNLQFSFMNKDNSLYKYYNFLLTAIKSGQYKVHAETSATVQKTEDTNEQEDLDGHYLHPSLVAIPAQPLLFKQAQPPPLPSVTYKPSADCTYSQLVSRIQGAQSESATPPPPLPSQEVPQDQLTYEQQQYYQQYYYAAQYYEYYKQVAQQFTGQNANQSPTNALQEAGITPEQLYALCQNQSELQNILQSHATYQQYIQQQPSNPYAQLVSNLSQTQGKEIHTSVVSSTTNLNDISKAPILYSKPESEPQVLAAVIGPQLPAVVQEIEQENDSKIEDDTIKQPLLSLAQYGSDSDNDEVEEAVEAAEAEEQDEETDEDLKIPPNELQLIIDKMAAYVSKNGKDFENIVRAKGDPRFHFLNPGHEYNHYYKMKMDETSNGVLDNGIAETAKEKKVVAPVSFSIKKPKEEMPKDIKSALPMEESDDELENGVASSPVAKSPNVVIISVTQVLAASHEIVHLKSLTPPLKETSTVPAAPLLLKQENREDETLPEEVSENNNMCKPMDAEDLLEMIGATEDGEEHYETKRVENNKKDKITATVKELQLERKKKAAAFLKLKSNMAPETDTKTEPSTEDGDIKITETNKYAVTNIDNSKTLDKSSKTIKSNSSKPSKLKINYNELNVIRNLANNKIMLHNTFKTAKRMKPAEEKVIEIIHIEDSDVEEGEIKKHKKSAKKKKSHKRKHSKSRHESRSSHHKHRSKQHKKSKKRHKNPETHDSNSSASSS